jgi:hypothetical protein
MTKAMRPLVIDDAARELAARVLAYAEGHRYRPSVMVTPPGDDPNHVAMFGTYRAVFSFTESDDMLWRHLSVSVPSAYYPNPAAVFIIAQLFGFTGWDGDTLDALPEGWLMEMQELEHCIVVAQPIGVEIEVPWS